MIKQVNKRVSLESLKEETPKTSWGEGGMIEERGNHGPNVKIRDKYLKSIDLR